MTGGGGVGKSLIIKTISEYANRFLKFPNQRTYQPSIMLTASTGIAAVPINGTTLHTGFSIPTSCAPLSKSSKQLQQLQNKFDFLKIVVVDEISMVAQTLFSTLDQNLRKIMRSDEPFGGVSILAVGDFCQLPPIMGGPVYSIPSTKSLEVFAPNMWTENFKIYERK